MHLITLTITTSWLQWIMQLSESKPKSFKWTRHLPSSNPCTIVFWLDLHVHWQLWVIKEPTLSIRPLNNSWSIFCSSIKCQQLTIFKKMDKQSQLIRHWTNCSPSWSAQIRSTETNISPQSYSSIKHFIRLFDIRTILVSLWFVSPDTDQRL